MSHPSHSSLDSSPLDSFASYAENWWDIKGPMALLHALNPVRITFMREQISTQFDEQKSLQAKTTSPLAGLHILDVGCGGGIVSEALARLGACVTGIDISKPLIVAAQQHAKQAGLSIVYKESTAEELAETELSMFDVVTCFEVLEHASCPHDVVKACDRLVKEKGLVFFSTPNRTLLSRLVMVNIAERVFKILPRGTHDWQTFIKPSELQMMLRETSLTPCAIKGLQYSIARQKFTLHPYKIRLNYFLSACKESNRASSQYASTVT